VKPPQAARHASCGKQGRKRSWERGRRAHRSFSSGSSPAFREDLAGKPLVGPAGRGFDEGLAAAGIDRRLAYVTNAVKHFKWEPLGKRRIRQKPNAAELAACRPWLDAELEAVRPQVLVVLGATAAQALLGRQFRVTKERGRPVESDLAPYVLATVHPSSILRHRTNEERAAAMKGFVSDLETVARLLARA
jgi:uracil-DNA glycosylase family protein